MRKLLGLNKDNCVLRISLISLLMISLAGCSPAIYNSCPPPPNAGAAVADDLKKIKKDNPSDYYDGLKDFFNRYYRYKQQVEIMGNENGSDG